MDRQKLVSLGGSTLYECASPHSALDPAIRTVWAGAATAGPAFTVSCPPNDNLGLHLAIEEAPPGSVLVVDAKGHIGGYWGEVLSVAAQARDIVALVIDGGVRDVAALARLGFAAFARGVSVRGTIKQAVDALGTPIVVGGVLISSGDWIVADDDGVVAISAADVERVAEAGAARVQKEAEMMAKLRGGATTVELLGLTGMRRPGAGVDR